VRVNGRAAIAWFKRSRSFIKSGLTLPGRAVLRKCYSTKLECHGIPTFVVLTGRDVADAWELLDDSLGMIEQLVPIWIGRLRNDILNFLVLDKIAWGEVGMISVVDRCIMVNPWNILDTIHDRRDSAAILARPLVYLSCLTSLLHYNRRGATGVIDAQRLSAAAQVRFLRRWNCEACSTTVSVTIASLEPHVRMQKNKIRGLSG